ncbi:hypothetical protein LAUMK191_05565 [Mycobacterium attenuatum]|nr:hypothetical protein LAUMK191_05565 [Mycobacterium attenuatum]
MSTNHGCRYAWCTSDWNASKAQRMEHTNQGWYGSATGNSISRSGSAYGETVKSVGVGLRYNADVDAGPILWLHIHGGPDNVDTDADMSLPEAVLLHRAIGDYLRAALVASDLDPDAVTEYYHVPPDGGGTK